MSRQAVTAGEMDAAVAELGPAAEAPKADAPKPPEPVPGLTPVEAQASKLMAELMAKNRIERPPIDIADGKLQLTGFDQCARVAQTLFLAATYPESWVSKKATSDKAAIAGITVALLFGAENGFTLSQTMTCVYMVNNKPALYGDGPIAKVRGSGKMVRIEEKWSGAGDTLKCSVRAVRRGESGGEDESSERSFGVADAKAQGLRGPMWGNPGMWPRMCQCRARAWVLRDLFADVLMGMAIQEEYEGVPTIEHVEADALTTKLVAAGEKK